jgi:transcriptional regulator with XRE-family HTH domain
MAHKRQVSRLRFHQGMQHVRLRTQADRRTERLRRTLVDDLRQLVADSGLTIAQIAAAAGLSPQYVSHILAGTKRPTLEAYGRLAAVLGADLHARLYPNSGPAIHDRHQAPVLEFLLDSRHPRWGTETEVLVRSPVRGWIDAAFHEPRERLIVATEIEEGLRRLEQQVRWSQAKAESLPSWDGWAGLGEPPPAISRLLVVRRTRTSRRVAGEFAGQLRVAFPAHPDDAIASITATQPWPGPALVWVVMEAGRVRFATGR